MPPRLHTAGAIIADPPTSTPRPATTAQIPTAPLMHPAMRDPAIAATWGGPVTTDPDVAPGHPVPIAADPDISGSRCNAVVLDARWRRRHGHRRSDIEATGTRNRDAARRGHAERGRQERRKGSRGSGHGR